MSCSRHSASSRRVVAAWLLGLLAGLGTATAAEDHKEPYRAGIRARDRGQWSEVVRLMTAAITLEPNPGGRLKIYGMRFETYTPYFQLGRAHFETGDCRAALGAFDEATRHGAIDTSERDELITKSEACRQRLDTTSANERNRVSVDDRDARIETDDGEGSGGDVPAHDSATDFATERIDNSTDTEWERQPIGLDSDSSPAIVRELPRHSDSNLPTATGPEVDGSLDVPPRQLEIRESPVETESPTTRPTLTPKRGGNPADTKPDGGAPPRVDALDALRRAAEAWLTAEYRDVIEQLDGADTDDAAERAAIHLLRAAARFALFRVGGETQAALRDAAAEDIRACRRSAPDLEPDPKYFSPAFLQFFLTVR